MSIPTKENIFATPSGQTLKVYKILHETDRSTIYKVVDINNQYYVLKVFSKYLNENKLNLHGYNEYCYARFFQEQQKKSSPKSSFSTIVSIIESFESSLDWFILCAYLGDKDLQQCVVTYQYYKHYYPKQFPIEDWYEKCRKVAYSILQGIGELHSCGIYHLDLSLENIFLHKDQIYLIDFESMFSTSTPTIKSEELRTVCWKSRYAPHEVYTKVPTMNVSNIDMYQLGITLFVLFVAQYPYEKIDDSAFLFLMKNGVGACCEKLKHKIDNRLAHLLDCMLGTCGRTIISVFEALEHPFFSESTAYIPCDEINGKQISNMRSPSPTDSTTSEISLGLSSSSPSSFSSV